MKRGTKQILLSVAAIVFMVVVLILSRNMDEDTKKLGIILFGSLTSLLVATLAIHIAAEVQTLQLEKWKAKRAARIHHYYEIDRESFNTIAKKAIADGTMRAFIKEIDANGKQYNVEVRFLTEEGAEV